MAWRQPGGKTIIWNNAGKFTDADTFMRLYISMALYEVSRYIENVL